MNKETDKSRPDSISFPIPVRAWGSIEENHKK